MLPDEMSGMKNSFLYSNFSFYNLDLQNKRWRLGPKILFIYIMKYVGKTECLSNILRLLSAQYLNASSDLKSVNVYRNGVFQIPPSPINTNNMVHYIYDDVVWTDHGFQMSMEKNFFVTSHQHSFNTESHTAQGQQYDKALHPSISYCHSVWCTLVWWR